MGSVRVSRHLHLFAEVRAASRDRHSNTLDNLIASHAIGLNLTLVTNNLEDFRSYPNLAVENWVRWPRLEDGFLN